MHPSIDWDIFLQKYASRCIFGRLEVLQNGYQFEGTIKLIEHVDHEAVSIYCNNQFRRKQFTPRWAGIGCARIVITKRRAIKDIGPEIETMRERFYVVLPEMSHAIIYTRDQKNF